MLTESPIQIAATLALEATDDREKPRWHSRLWATEARLEEDMNSIALLGLEGSVWDPS